VGWPPTPLPDPARAPAHRRPSWVKPAMQVYNIAQIALCLYMAIGMWPATFPNAPNIFGLGSKYTAAGEWYILIHYLSKFMDW
jgi:elongation of very long chain fatty acids protein 4